MYVIRESLILSYIFIIYRNHSMPWVRQWPQQQISHVNFVLSLCEYLSYFMIYTTKLWTHLSMFLLFCSVSFSVNFCIFICCNVFFFLTWNTAMVFNCNETRITRKAGVKEAFHHHMDWIYSRYILDINFGGFSCHC